MNQSVSLYRKFMGTAALMVISRGLVMVSGIIFARYLGPEQYGLYSFALAIIAIATLPVVAGLPTLLTREVANYHLEKKWDLLNGVMKWSRFYVLGFSLIIATIMCLALYFGFFDITLSNLLWCAVLLVPARGMLTQQGAILNGFRQPIKAQLPTQLLVPLITLILVILLFFWSVDLTGSKLITISVLASIIAFFVSGLLLNRVIESNTKISRTKYNIKNWHSSLLPFTIMSFISTLNTELASILLGWLVDNESVAYFKVAMQAVGLIALGAYSINAVIMPNVARLYKKEDLEGTQALLTKSVRLSALISLPMIFFLIIFGEFTIELLFGKEYLQAYPILVILCLGQLFNVSTGSVGLVLNMTDNEKSALKSLYVTLILNLVLLAVLVPLYGGVGAAIAVSLSLVCWNVLMAVDVWRLTGLKPWLRPS
ncbi:MULTISPECIES: flippase [unclassified Pseudoalteromonas]|uniref:flippase n=1 Tax=unclassified Pseudoalteromonas TaxID=194690 RepID=UPI00041336A6|nr:MULTISPECIES: flippase [unclassified Pseudoalteromonas]